jgi:peroxiredoxin
MKVIYFCLALLTAVHAGAAEPESSPAISSGFNTLQAEPVMNFALPDATGKLHELRRTDARAVVLYFTMNGCPIARQSYAKLRTLRKQFGDEGVAIWIINSDDSVTASEVEKEARTYGAGSTPALLDDAQGVTRMLGVKRTCEVIAISSSDFKIFYRGAVDDQLTEGARKPAASTNYRAASTTAWSRTRCFCERWATSPSSQRWPSA